LGSRAPAPGGGSTSALLAAMGAALGAMMGWMTYGKRKFEDKDAVMRRLIPPLNQAMLDLIPMIDADTRAFNDYLAALGMPKDTPEQAAERARALHDGIMRAIDVPLAAMRIADGCWGAMKEMAEHGNIASRSDLEVGARVLEVGIWGAWRNVVINLPQIEDAGERARIGGAAEALATRAREASLEVLDTLARRS
jgi:glutamate formiminotransferase/formiminotetrahydrofolate cyclodeaminase